MNETLRRALRTFFQAAVGYIAVNIGCAAADIEDGGTVRTVLIGLIAAAAAAGIAAVMNLPGNGGDTDD